MWANLLNYTCVAKKTNLFPQIDRVNFATVLLPTLPLLPITAHITNCTYELKLIKNKATV